MVYTENKKEDSTLNIKKLYFIGKNGGLLSPLDGDASSSLITERLLFGNNQAPCFISSSAGVIDLDICHALYHKQGIFGPYGDLIEVMAFKANDLWHYYMTSVNPLAYPKPAIAVDVVLFLKNGLGEEFFVGIIRKGSPGKGCLALPGGFLNVKGYDAELPLKAAIRETNEEIRSLKLRKEQKISREDNMPKHINVTAHCPFLISGTMTFLGLFPTSDQEKLSKIERKRVDFTFAFLVRLHTSEALTASLILDHLKAGSDASRIVVTETSAFNDISFGLYHHKYIFKEALAFRA